MIIVIDGYNVLKQEFKTKKISDACKTSFIKSLSAYRAKKKHAIIVVFDGGPFEWPSKEQLYGILIVHSGVHETADEWIKHYIEKYRSNDLILVSTDRELGAAARRFGIHAIDAHDFYTLVQEELKEYVHVAAHNKQSAVKTSEDESIEIDELMEEASRSVKSKAEDFIEEHKRKPTPQKMSKKERKFLQKIKKL